MSGGYFHSVRLKGSACIGCVTCVKYCPTEAIRVRNGKAIILAARCIDCGECIRRCPHHAKVAVMDSLSEMRKYKYNIIRNMARWGDPGRSLPCRDAPPWC